MKRRWTGWLLVGLLAGPGGLTLSSAARAATIRVDPEGAGDFTEIQPAIDAAQDGDTVLVAPGEYAVAKILFNPLQDPETPEGPPVKNISLISSEGPDETFLSTDPRKSSSSFRAASRGTPWSMASRSREGGSYAGTRRLRR